VGDLSAEQWLTCQLFPLGCQGSDLLHRREALLDTGAGVSWRLQVNLSPLDGV
jgi:hypothetical protein